MQGIRHTDGNQARMEPHEIFLVVSGDVDILVVHGDERSYEETSKVIPTLSSRDRTGSLQKTFADPPKDWVEKSW